MNLLIAQYNETNEARATEYAECLQRNLENRFVDQVVVFFEDDSLRGHYQGDGVSLVPLGRRVRFADFFVYANLYLRDQVCIVANADIYFDETLNRLQGFDLNGKFLCLSRWEIDECGRLQQCLAQWSQDAWIFRTPLPAINGEFELGRMKCDNRIAFEAREAGLQLLNPSHTVRAIHLHASRVRNYNEADYLKGPGAWVPPHELGSQPPLVELRDAPTKHPMGFNVHYALQNGLLPIQTLTRKG